MMHNTVRLSLFILLLTIIGQFLHASQYLDSVLISRNNQLSDYYRFKDGMKERTWINMVNLNSKALFVIETDNLILDNHLQHEMNKAGELINKLEKSNLEILLLNREIEVNSIMLEEQRFLNSNLVIITGIVIVLFVIVLILFIDRQIRFRSTRMELERFWARNDDSQITGKKNDDFEGRQNEINALIQQNNTIKQELEEMNSQKRRQDNQLLKEINSRQEVEKEIKQLISQIKNLS